MGIKKLFQFLSKHAQSAISTITLDDLSGARVAIDISLYVYQFHIVALARSIKNVDGKHINHLQGILHKLSLLTSYNISPVCVFDGPPPQAKLETLTKRKKIESMKTIFTEVKELVKLMGIPYVNAPSEAEAECAYLNKIGKVDYVITEDLDALVFGANFVVKNLKAKGGILIDRQKILTELNITQEQFVQLCLLFGSDYTPSIPRAYKYINTPIEQIPFITAKHKEAASLFLDPEVTDIIETPQKKDVELTQFLYGINKLSKPKTQTSLDRLAPIAAELFIY